MSKYKVGDKVRYVGTNHKHQEVVITKFLIGNEPYGYLCKNSFEKRAVLLLPDWYQEEYKRAHLFMFDLVDLLRQMSIGRSTQHDRKCLSSIAILVRRSTHPRNINQRSLYRVDFVSREGKRRVLM